MKPLTPYHVLVTLLILTGSACNRPPGEDPDHAIEAHVAVASNFMPTIEILTDSWQRETGYTATLTSGSTGKLYAQIEAGAPFHLFLAADTLRPALLDHLALDRRPYATGRLALWSPSRSPKPGRTALANPETAPYGAAALDVLSSAPLWQDTSWWSPPPNGLVFGESVSQAFTFVATGHAHRGFVALSSLIHAGVLHSDSSGHFQADGSQGLWIIPDSLHAPIDQHMVLLSGNPAARSFFGWMRTPAARRIMRAHGYETP